MHREPRVAVVIPALDEEEALPLVLGDLESLQRSGACPRLQEIIVVDNGSRDRTAEIARQAGATVLQEPRRGYGAACLRALRYLRDHSPEIVLFMDADRSDDAAEIPKLLRPIQEQGFDLVIGSRSRGQRERGALLPQARFGNWLATGLIRLAYGFRYTDLGPFRAVRTSALEKMRLRDLDYGWTIEMQIRALQTGARITEVPVRYRRRVGRSKISGTLMGSVRAGRKILSTFWRLRVAVLAWLVVLAATALPRGVTAAGHPSDGPGAVASQQAVWDRLLSHYVDSQGLVAYRDLQRQAEDSLSSYMRFLAKAEPDAWERQEQLAFWINAYNAGVIWAVLQGESPEPMLGRAKIFKVWKYEVAGKKRTLDEVEHEILRQRFREPRIHFALVCAASSCPALRNEAYVPGELDRQLDEQARRFINDVTKNRFSPDDNSLRLSKIFDWFRQDFEREGPLREFLARFVTQAPIRDWLRSAENLQIEFADYDWTLNAQPQQRPGTAKP